MEFFVGKSQKVCYNSLHKNLNMGVHKMNNWKKLLKNNITTAKELKEVLKLSKEEVIKMEEIVTIHGR